MLTDFGGVARGEAKAVSLVEDLDGLQRAASQGRRLRARCFGHSMNGMSVPRADELLVDLAGVRHVVWRGEGALTAGAGLSVWEVDRHARKFGWKLPVINDGGAAAPSLGGFVAAGGIGEGAMLHGGFWESVSAMTVVGADGAARRIGRGDPDFAWMFGSMGTLGIIFEVTLDLEQAGARRPRAVEAAASLAPIPPAVWPPHLWLTLFVSEARRDEAIQRLVDLTSAHPGVWETRGVYEYFMRFRRFNPPLVFPDAADFVALGIWGDRNPAHSDLDAYFALEADFQAMVETCGFRRYFQSELIGCRRSLERYVGKAVADQYQSIKASADPLGLLSSFMPA